MSCNLTTGFAIPCGKPMGGTREVYIQQFDKFSGGSDAFLMNATEVVTGLTWSSSAVTSFFQYQFEPETAEWKDNTTNSTNATFAEQTFSMQINYTSTANRNELNLLLQKPVVIIHKDEQDRYVILGTRAGMRVTTLSQGAGKAAGDLNGYMVSFAGKCPKNAQEISSTAFTYS